MHSSSMVSGTRAQALTFLALQPMPCGCVAAVYQARPGGVEVELVEAKGPHCLFYGHQMGLVVRLGLPVSAFGEAAGGVDSYA